MKKLYVLIVLFVTLVSGTSCRSTKPLFDASQADAVPVVLRVEYVHTIGGSEMWVSQVRVLSVIKNDTSDTFEGVIRVLHWGRKPYAPPPGVSTIYLEPVKGYSCVPWCMRQRGPRRGDTAAIPGYSHAEQAPHQPTDVRRLQRREIGKRPTN